jgi:hypothetical protein
MWEQLKLELSSASWWTGMILLTILCVWAQERFKLGRVPYFLICGAVGILWSEVWRAL